MVLALAVGPVHASSASGRSCVGLSAPITGSIVAVYEPIGRYEGHWGIDFGDATEAVVRSAASGRVVFTGVVVGNRTITIDHGAGLRTSYSFLHETHVRRGAWVPRGTHIATAGPPGEHGVLHFSVRRDGSYVDPEPLLGCLPAAPSEGLALLPPPR